jgi:hypothetical protein
LFSSNAAAATSAPRAVPRLITVTIGKLLTVVDDVEHGRLVALAESEGIRPTFGD